MNKVKLLKLITAIWETMLAVPLFWGLIVVSMLWAPLAIMLVLHILTLVFSIKEKEDCYGSVSWIITSMIAFIPFVWMIMHMITAILLWVEFTWIRDKKDPNISG